ncbi:MAG: ABC transporter permease [Verrucomicrobiota bacterium]|nr:ABC transporter permease [Verrucomicrobiota bacterium]
MNTILLPAWTLLVREIVRFYRQRSRVLSSIATPLVFWVFFGFGLNSAIGVQVGSTHVKGLVYLYPGFIVLNLLFASIFSTISIIEDRREGFMQSVLVSPVSPVGIVLGKVLGGTLLAMSQGILFLLIAPFLGIRFSIEGLMLGLWSLFWLSAGLTSLGFYFAWKMNSTQGFHGVMNLFLMPMWLLSGSFFPVDTAPRWMAVAMKINPITYGLEMFRESLHAVPQDFPSLKWILLKSSILIIFAGVFFVASVFGLRKRTTGDLL